MSRVTVTAVRLPRQKYINEHKRLVRVLRKPTKRALAKEAKEQAEDLKEARK